MREKIGGLLIGTAIVCFAVNFNILGALNLPSFISSFFNLQWLWNPLSNFTPMVTGGVPIIGGTLGAMLNYVWAVIYSGILLVLGVVLVK
jgi:hypothetical protein